ncbi:MAG: hypothetical protein U0165_09810 [Polyangiaceae bacterium]
MSRACIALFALGLTAVGASCNYYDPPPEASIFGAKEAVLADNKVPLVIKFTESVKPETLRLEVALYEVDTEGDLNDEQKPPKPLNTLFTHTPTAETGGTGVLSDGNQTFTITFTKPPPIGKRLVLLIEPGLSDTDGNDTVARRKILFGYQFGGGLGTKIFTTGYYMFLINVTKPIPVQIQVFGDIRADQTAGTYIAQFTNADRNMDLTRAGCAGLGCNEGKDACRLIPAPKCVAPSEKAASADEYSDYIPFGTPPRGYSFYVQGYLADQGDGSVAITNDPVDVATQAPEVTISDLVLNGAFTPDANGILRGTGSFTSSDVGLFGTPSGAGEGTLVAIRIPEGKAPKDIPPPDGFEPLEQ